MQCCGWVSQDLLYIAYHGREWGVPGTDDNKLSEMICLEDQQAGLSWITVLKKRENYRHVSHHFDPERVVVMTKENMERLVLNAGIIRHCGKIQTVISNTRTFLTMAQDGELFSEFAWSFVDSQPQVTRVANLSDIPTSTPAPDALSKALEKYGFKFVGAAICYSFMQTRGLADDHITSCICYSGEQHDS